MEIIVNAGQADLPFNTRMPPGSYQLERQEIRCTDLLYTGQPAYFRHESAVKVDTSVLAISSVAQPCADKSSKTHAVYRETARAIACADAKKTLDS